MEYVLMLDNYFLFCLGIAYLGCWLAVIAQGK